MFPPDEELIDQPCIVCKGDKVWTGKVCFHCLGEGTEQWPKRCGHDCQKCRLPPVNPVFKIGDAVMFGYEFAYKDTITDIFYTPCQGNHYQLKVGVAEDAEGLRLAKEQDIKLARWF